MGGSSADLSAAWTQTSNTSNKVTTIDPDTKRLNELRLEQLQNIFTGAYQAPQGNPINALQNFANLDSSSMDIINNALGINTQGLQPQQWYNQSRNDLYPGQQQSYLQDLYGQGQNAINTQSQDAFGAIAAQGNNNLSYINGDLANRLLGSGQDYFRQILSPQIQNQSALMGLARSGANEEAQAKGAASISLPISQLIAQLGASSNQQTQALQGQLRGQNLGLNEQNILSNFQGQQGLNTQYLQNLYGLNQQNPNVDIGLQNAQLSRLGQQLQFADYSRQTGQQAYGTLGNLYLSAINQTPYTPVQNVNTATLGNSTSVSGSVTAKAKE